VTLNPSRNTFTLANHTPRVLILIPSKAHNTLWQHNQKYRRLRRDYTCLQNNLKSVQMQSYSTLLENPKLWCEYSNLESTLSQLKNSNLFFFSVWQDKQIIYIFQRLVKAFNEGAYSVGNHLKHIQPSKQNSIRIFKETIGWNHETTDCLVCQLSQPNLNSFLPFQKHLRVKQPVDSTKQQVVFT